MASIFAAITPLRCARTRSPNQRWFGAVGAEPLYCRSRCKYDASVVVTAHHRNDQAETVMANILRGSGPVGLGGMPRQRSLTSECRLLRPLLQASHQQCCDYLTQRQLPWTEDGSNTNRKFWRNRLRHDVLPALEAGRQVSPMNYSPFLTNNTNVCRARYRRRLPSMPAPRAKRACAWMCFWKRQSIFAFWCGDTLRKPGPTHGTAHPAPTRQLIAGPCWPALERERTVFAPPQVADGKITSRGRGPQAIAGTGQFTVHQGELIIQQKREVMDLVASPNEAFVNAAAVEGPLHWRLPQEGERWRPFGGEGSKPILRFLADRGVPSYARRIKGILADDTGVVWIPGFTIADRVQVFPQTDTVMHLRFQPEEVSTKSDLFI